MALFHQERGASALRRIDNAVVPDLLQLKPCGLQATGCRNWHWRPQYLADCVCVVAMAACVQLPDPLDEIHPGRHSPKDGETLTVGIAFAAKIEPGLIAHADEELGATPGAGGIAGQRNGTVDMPQAGLRGRFMWHRRPLPHAGTGAPLDDVDGRVPVIVIGPYDTEKAAAIIGTRVNITQEVIGGERCAIGAQQQRQVAKRGNQLHGRTDHWNRGCREQTPARYGPGHPGFPI